MRVVFFPAGDRTRASSRYRVWWIVPDDPDFMVADGNNWRQADVLVFQRTFSKKWRALAKKAKSSGKLVLFDCTEWFFMEGWKRLGAVDKMAGIAHALTCGVVEDQRLMQQRYKKRVHVIPNAQRLGAYPLKKKHRPVARPRVIWFGRVGNMRTLESIWPVFQRLARDRVSFEVLIVNDDGQTHGLKLDDKHPVIAKKWGPGIIINELIVSADVAVNPKIKQADGYYHKDINKSVTAWMCGLPCITFGMTNDWYGDLRRMLTDWRLRERNGKKNIERARAWDSSNVVKQWRKVFVDELKRLRGVQ